MIDDEAGISPLIGAIMMVGIVMVLAAVIAVIITGMGGSLQTQPLVTFDVEQTNVTKVDADGNVETLRYITITHDGGENLNMEHIRVTTDGKRAFGVYDGSSELAVKSIWQTEDDTVSAGDSITIVARTNSATYDEIDDGNSYVSWTSNGHTPTYEFGSTVEMKTGTGGTYDSNVQNQKGEQVRIIWERDEFGTSATLFRYEIR